MPYNTGIRTPEDNITAIEQNIHGQSNVYPTLAAPVLVAGGALAWALSGVPVNIIPPLTIPNHFVITVINVEGFLAPGNFELVLNNSLGEIGRVRFNNTNLGAEFPPVPVRNCPVQPPNEPIDADLGSAIGGNSVDITLGYLIIP